MWFMDSPIQDIKYISYFPTFSFISCPGPLKGKHLLIIFFGTLLDVKDWTFLWSPILTFHLSHTLSFSLFTGLQWLCWIPWIKWRERREGKEIKLFHTLLHKCIQFLAYKNEVQPQDTTYHQKTWKLRWCHQDGWRDSRSQHTGIQ